jgi:hypothetical protein
MIMPKTSNSPKAIRAPEKRFAATEIRSLTLDEIQFVSGGKGVQHQDIRIVKFVDASTPALML